MKFEVYEKRMYNSASYPYTTQWKILAVFTKETRAIQFIARMKKQNQNWIFKVKNSETRIEKIYNI